jgi:hypothetical protein
VVSILTFYLVAQIVEEHIRRLQCVVNKSVFGVVSILTFYLVAQIVEEYIRSLQCVVNRVFWRGKYTYLLFGGSKCRIYT